MKESSSGDDPFDMHKLGVDQSVPARTRIIIGNKSIAKQIAGIHFHLQRSTPRGFTLYCIWLDSPLRRPARVRFRLHTNAMEVQERVRRCLHKTIACASRASASYRQLTHLLGGLHQPAKPYSRRLGGHEEGEEDEAGNQMQGYEHGP